MATPEAPPDGQRPTMADGRAALLTSAGLVFLALGVVFGVAYLVGEVRSSLFPTGWIFPLVLAISGGLMATRRRFDIVATLWAGLLMAVFLLDALVYMRTLDQGFEDPAAFDASVIVGALALVPLVLRPLFRS